MANVHLSTEDYAKCEAEKAILEKEFSQNHTISFLARRVGTNENKLKHGFKQMNQQTIHSFVTTLRIEKAKELLECTGLPVETIAYKLGLDQSNLIKQFKRSTGLTPKEWRTNKKEPKTCCRIVVYNQWPSKNSDSPTIRSNSPICRLYIA